MKVAVFTPLNPARCGVSDYSEALLAHLAEHVETTVFVDEDPPGRFAGDEKMTFRPAAEFEPAEFDETVYHIGNNSYHLHAYHAAIEHPGIVVLHEFNLHHLMAAATITQGDWDAYLAEAEYNGGAEALAFAKRVRSLEIGPDYEGLAMNRRLLERSKALIVHSPFLRGRVRAAGFDLPIAHIPHGAGIPEVNRQQYRAKLGLDESTPLIGVFGFLKPYKRIAESLRALARLVQIHPEVRMILAGEEHQDFPVRRLISQLDLGPFVRLLGHVEIGEFEQWIGAVDICLNLRYPTYGETSGTLLRALGLGRAVVVSDIGSFADLPDEVCLKVPVGEDEVDIIRRYLDLLVTRPEVARGMGAAARDYVARECAWPHVAELYASWIAAVAQGRAEVDQLARPAETAPPEREQDEAPDAPTQPVALPAPVTSNGAAPATALQQARRTEFADYLRGLTSPFGGAQSYLESHLARLVKTLEMTPPGSASDGVLEMGAYMQLTPALSHLLGYGEVRGCYLGVQGKTDHVAVQTADGRKFACDIDLFDAEKHAYPYEDGRFSTVLCCELLEHLYDDPMHMMAELNRILAPGGRLVLSTPNICSLRAVGAILLGYHPGFFPQYIQPDDQGQVAPRHAREYAPRDIHALFEAAGFEVARLETGPYTTDRTAEYDWVKHVIRRYELPDHLRGEAIYAVGRKVGPVAERYPVCLYSQGTS